RAARGRRERGVDPPALYLDLVGGETVTFALAEATSSVMLRGKDEHWNTPPVGLLPKLATLPAANDRDAGLEKRSTMGRQRHGIEQIIAKLREAEVELP